MKSLLFTIAGLLVAGSVFAASSTTSTTSTSSGFWSSTVSSTTQSITSLREKLKKSPLDLALIAEINAMKTENSFQINGTSTSLYLPLSYKLGKNNLALTPIFSVQNTLRGEERETNSQLTYLRAAWSRGLLNQDKHGINLAGWLGYSQNISHETRLGSKSNGDAQVRITVSRDLSKKFSLMTQARYYKMMKRDSAPNTKTSQGLVLAIGSYSITEKLSASAGAYGQVNFFNQRSDQYAVYPTVGLGYQASPSVSLDLSSDTTLVASNDQSTIVDNWLINSGVCLTVTVLAF